MKNSSNKKKVKMPRNIQNKLMAAIAMVVVSAILVVTSTYAWFTLSTAPEITGITTSIGANGNLEIALLNTNTYENTELITSNVGDSSAAQNVTDANITWGNLVDLSDASYGLSGINLLPADANEAVGKLSLNSLLKTAVYGADGRVSALEANTVSAIKTENGFVYDAEAGQDYGVRAVGVSSDVSARQLAFASAVSTARNAISSASKPSANAVNAQKASILALAIAGGAPDTYTQSNIDGLKAIANGIDSSLTSIVNSYKAVIIAKLTAKTDTKDEDIMTVVSSISGASNAAALNGLLDGDLAAYATDYGTDLTALATAQTNVADAKTACNNFVAEDVNIGDIKTPKTPATTVKTDIVEKLVGSSFAAYKADGADVELDPANAADIKTVYMNGGALGTVATFAGSFKLTSVDVDLYAFDVYAGTKTAVATDAKLYPFAGAVGALEAPAGGSVATINNAYGYVLDFAFRTNAAGSNLQLQTEKVNRVYEDATVANLATQGAGSTITFAKAGGLTDAQAASLVKAIRIKFFDPTDGTVLATAEAANLTVNAETGATEAKIRLIDSAKTKLTGTAVWGRDTYEAVTYTAEDEQAEPTHKAGTIHGYKLKDATLAEISEEAPETMQSGGMDISVSNAPALTLKIKDYKALKRETYITGITRTTGAPEDTDNIVALNQNEVKKVSVLVYLDGNFVDNMDVINDQSTGTLDINLQFSSDAELKPMDNSTLKQMTK